MERNIEIQQKSFLRINIVGIFLVLAVFLVVFIYIILAWFDKLSFEENMTFSIIILLALSIAISFSLYRIYEKAILTFDNNGLIISVKNENILIKYDAIEGLKNTGKKDTEDNTIEFLIKTKSSKRYRIKSDFEIYNDLLELFTGKGKK